MTKLSLTLPDGSQVEMRDNATDGAPYATPGGNGAHPSFDMDRGRVWHSTDGSAVTYITDASNGVVNHQLGGWVFLSDGTHIRMEGTDSGHGTRIIDRNGNFVSFDYSTPGGMTYTDEIRIWLPPGCIWTSITTPDSAVVTTAYDGNTVTVTDQHDSSTAGHSRKSVSDGLGRLTSVYEDPSTGGLNYQTSYSYDTLDNLLSVTQGTQTRTFVYDSLKRLISATNPESGTICYGTLSAGQCQSDGYDANGNLIKKTDARLIVSTYGYDALNRNTTVDYSDTAGINPDITRVYDGATKGVGRLWESYAGGSYSVGSNVEHTKVNGYDALGRP